MYEKKSQNFFYTYDPFKKWLNNPENENLPLMPLPIYKKIFISESPGAVRPIQSTPNFGLILA